MSVNNETLLSISIFEFNRSVVCTNPSFLFCVNKKEKKEKEKKIENKEGKGHLLTYSN